MKMRNLLRSIPFLLLMMSGLSLVFNCNGINSNSSQTLPPATVTVTFTVKGGNGTLTAKAGNTELTSPASVKKDTDVAFTPNPNSGYEVDYLLINGVKKSGTTVTVKADKNITAIVKFKTPGDPETQLFTVDYKAEPAAGGSISAKYSDGTVFSSGGKIETGTSLVFTAEPNSGYTISAWAGATESPDKKTATLTVTANSSVTVMFAENTAQQVTIRFDSSKMVCWKNPNEITLTGTLISDGASVYENDELLFMAKPTAGKMVDSWTLNNLPSGSSFMGNSFFYQVKAQPSDLNIDYTEKTAEKLTLQFDTSKIQCKKLVDDSPIAPGLLDAGDMLVFSTKNGSAVTWKANNQPFDPHLLKLKNYALPFTKEMAQNYGNEHTLTISYDE